MDWHFNDVLKMYGAYNLQPIMPQPSSMLQGCTPYNPQQMVPGLQQEYSPQPRLFMPPGQMVPQSAPPSYQPLPSTPVQQGALQSYAPQAQAPPLAQAPMYH
jgi:hypothetical protein